MVLITCCMGRSGERRTGGLLVIPIIPMSTFLSHLQQEGWMESEGLWRGVCSADRRFEELSRCLFLLPPSFEACPLTLTLPGEEGHEQIARDALEENNFHTQHCEGQQVQMLICKRGNAKVTQRTQLLLHMAEGWGGGGRRRGREAVSCYPVDDVAFCIYELKYSLNQSESTSSLFHTIKSVGEVFVLTCS